MRLFENLLGADRYSLHRPAIPLRTGASGLVVARVKSIDLSSPENLGVIEYETLYTPTRKIGRARPLSTNYKHYPVVDEIVFLVDGPSKDYNDQASSQESFYSTPFALWATNHHNKAPGLNTLVKKTVQSNPSTEVVQAGIPNAPQVSESETISPDLKEKADVKTLRPYIGDIIFEGRWGQSIRFGSTSTQGSNPWSKSGTEGDPILVLTNGHKATSLDNWDLITEDINIDDAGIWMTSTQELQVEDIKTNFSLESFMSQRGLSKETILSVPSLPTSYTTISRLQQDLKNKPV